MGSALVCLELLGTEADLHRVKFHVFADGEDQLGTGCITEALQQINGGAGSAAFETRDGRLRSAHARRQFLLGESCPLAQVVGELGKLKSIRACS